jgi:acetyl-CoA C-acetyltransferase
MRMQPINASHHISAKVVLGHSVSATGAIITTKLIYELDRKGGRFGLVTMCIGGGQGIAAIWERL